MTRFGHRCDACLLPRPQCACELVLPRRAALDIVVVRHQLEVPKVSNSGRWIGSLFDNARLIDGAVTGEPLHERVLAALDDGTVLLFPDGEPSAAPPRTPSQLVAIDATWPQARRMRQRIPALRALPAWRLPAPASASVPRLREPKLPHQMATAWAVARALACLGHDDDADALSRLFRDIVRRFDEATG